ncbi:MAG: TrmH family RNA methyltransferase [Oscillospiraceae bacterium]|nr:TrmH family RNA methyltransferase [Oscillospiraceae bacterium]
MKVQRYKHDLDHSYALGATLTYELLKNAPHLATRVYLSSSLERTAAADELLALCKKHGVPTETNDKAFNILSPKGNCFIIGEFRKQDTRIKSGSHVVLVNPSDAGNLGTILRTATGFGLTDIAIVRQAVDFYDPRTIRASMGAAFHVNVEYFDRIEDYIARFPENRLYAFMLTASVPIHGLEIKKPFSLVFGNEATGLPDCYADFCRSVIIPHSHDIDSLNLPIAASIAMYEFTKDRWGGR